MSKFDGTFIGVDTSGYPYDFAACAVMKRTDEHICIVIENFQMPMKTREDSIVFESRVCELEKKYNAIRI